MASLDNQHPTVTRQLTYLFLTLFYLDSLIGLLVFIDQMSKKLTFLDFLAPYDQWLALADVAIFGWLAIGSGSRWAHSMAVAYTSADTAGVVRIILRIVATGVLVSAIVSLLTSSSAAALTIGSFTVLVAGFATQTVLGNAVAGLFVALFRPIRVGDNVTAAGNSGAVVTITLMHTILETEDREIMIPNSNIANSVLIRHRKLED